MAILLKKLNKAVPSAAVIGVSLALVAAPVAVSANDKGPNLDVIPHAIEDSQDVRDFQLGIITTPQLAQNSKKSEPSLLAKGDELAQAAADVNDPIEPVNRVMFQINEFLHGLILRPLAELYMLILPDEGQEAVGNFLDNLRSPVVLANDLLQGEMKRAWTTTKRLAINSTLGLGGAMDVADKWGIKGHSEDLGQTFAVWGIPDGFYLVLPIFGPSNPRDAVGTFLDSYLDPVSHWLDNTHRDDWSTARTVVGGVDEFAGVMDDLQKLKETSIDYYAALRSISRQKRQAEIRNGASSDAPLPDLKYDFNADLNTK
ncbi:MAG: VacJ family lipoprotein [Alphaproteobacteria bacterium]|nr:VacJ family lipoprotein [Alphaproteobacteria bacterium]